MLSLWPSRGQWYRVVPFSVPPQSCASVSLHLEQDSRNAVAETVKGLAAHTAAATSALAETDAARARLTAWIAEREAADTRDAAAAAAPDGVVPGAARGAVLPADALSAKMLDLAAEAAALEDTLYALDRGLRRGAVGLDAFMKHSRDLARQQFFCQAHMAKIVARQQELGARPRPAIAHVVPPTAAGTPAARAPPQLPMPPAPPAYQARAPGPPVGPVPAYPTLTSRTQGPSGY